MVDGVGWDPVFAYGTQELIFQGCFLLLVCVQVFNPSG